MSSLKATHTAYRVANEILSTPTPALTDLREKTPRHRVVPIEFMQVSVRWMVQPFLRWPTWKEAAVIFFLWASAAAIAYDVIAHKVK